LGGEFRGPIVNVGVMIRPRMISLEPESARVAEGSPQTPIRQREMRKPRELALPGFCVNPRVPPARSRIDQLGGRDNLRNNARLFRKREPPCLVQKWLSRCYLWDSNRLAGPGGFHGACTPTLKWEHAWGGKRLDVCFPVSASRLPAAAVAAGPLAASAAVAAPAPAGALFARPGLVDGQRAALELGAAEVLDRLLRPRRHLDEREAPRPAGVPVGDDLGRLDGAEPSERLGRSSAVVAKGKLPTYSFLLMVILPRGLPGPGKDFKTHSRRRRRERGANGTGFPGGRRRPEASPTGVGTRGVPKRPS
jgi:hypothetical protein